MRIDGARIARVVEAPDRRQKLLAGEDAAGRAREMGEEVELARLELDLLPFDGHAAAPDVDGKTAELDALRRRAVTRRRAAKHRADARDELDHRKRLGEVVVRADLETDHGIELGVARGQH